MIQRLLNEYRIAEAKGHLKPGLAVKATMATVLEAGCRAFYQGYFGQGWNAAASEVRKAQLAGDNAQTIKESLLTDVTRVSRVLREAHTTTDFPLILQNLRDRVIRQEYAPVEDTPIMAVAMKRTLTSFRPVQGVRFNSLDRLVLRPEGTDVKKTTIGYTEDGYAIANYELGVDFTWEMWKNDDISIFQNMLMALGVAARRTRSLVLLEAVSAGLSQTTLTTAGGPTIARLEQLITSEFGAEVNTEGKPMGVSMTDIAFPTKWKTTAAVALHSAEVNDGTTSRTPKANPVFNAATPHEDRIMREILTDDWLAYDNQANWLEFAVLDDFAGGPLSYTKMPDVNEHPDQGSFDNHSMSVKIGDAHGSKVTSTKGVRRVKGA